MAYQIDEKGNLVVIEAESYTKELPQMYVDDKGELRAGKKPARLATAGR